MLPARLTFELADGDIITSEKVILALLNKATANAHLICDGIFEIQPFTGNSFYYEIGPLGTSAVRRSFVNSLIPTLHVRSEDILTDVAQIISQERDRVKALIAPAPSGPTNP